MNILFVAATSQEITSKKINTQPNLITGLGMVNTAMYLTKELINNNFDLVINMGIAGTFSSTLKKGDVVEVIEDYFSEIGYEDDTNFCSFKEFDLKTKLIVKAKTKLKPVKAITVNTVHGNKKSIQSTVNLFNPDIETMEGAAFFKVCNYFNVPCMQIRSISNRVEKRNKSNWDIDLAIANLNMEVEKIIMDL
tara:strand:- start:569 stop:1147 length:579 start_codon:yes stop_codon:yes gene_type:complete